MNRREAISALVSLPATATLSAADVATTDVIVVECEDPISLEAQHRIWQVLSEVWPGRKAIILDRGMRLRIAKG